MLELLRNGFVWHFHNDNDHADEVLRSLLSLGLVTSRCDIKPDFYKVTFDGEALLEFREQEIAKQLKQAADNATAKKKDRAFDIFSLSLGAIITLIASNLAAIVSWIRSLFH